VTGKSEDLTYRAFIMADNDAVTRIAPAKWIRNKKTNRHIGQDVRDMRKPLKEFWTRSSYFPTRFGDGSFAVLYTAEAKATALREVCNYLYKTHANGNLPAEKHIGLFEVGVSGNRLDLTSKPISDPRLVHPTDYSFCQDTGRTAREHHSFIEAPSARDFDGICYASFQEKAANDLGGTVYYKMTANQSSKTYSTNVDGKKFEVDIHDVYSKVNNKK